MFITGLGTAAPASCFSQKECGEVFSKSPICEQLEPRSRAIVRKVLTSDNGSLRGGWRWTGSKKLLNYRRTCCIRAFCATRQLLATQAASRALEDAGIAPGQIDAVIGWHLHRLSLPGFEQLRNSTHGVAGNILALDLVGQGCGAALPNLRVPAKRCSGPDGRTNPVGLRRGVQRGFMFDNDPGVLVSACLFGDGAGAAVLANEPNPRRVIRWVNSTSFLEPKDRDLLRFEQRRHVAEYPDSTGSGSGGPSRSCTVRSTHRAVRDGPGEYLRLGAASWRAGCGAGLAQNPWINGA